MIFWNVFLFYTSLCVIFCLVYLRHPPNSYNGYKREAKRKELIFQVWCSKEYFWFCSKIRHFPPQGKKTSKTHFFRGPSSLVAQMVKNLPARPETCVRFLGWEDPMEEDMATHSSILAWRIPWTEELGGLQSMGSQGVGHDWAIKHTLSAYGEEAAVD